MIEGKRAFRRLLVCLLAASVLMIAAAPVLRTDSSIVWAKSKKKKMTTSPTKKKKNKKNGFFTKNGYWYYYVEDKKQTGWIKVGKREYYAYKTGYRKGRLATGWVTLKKGTAKKQEYFFRENGKKGKICSVAIDGEAVVNGITCIFDKKGVLKKCKYAGDTNGFVNEVGELARMNQVRNDILASLVVAQACVETGFGSSIYHNNLFGIREGYGYRKYNSWQESIDDYVEFMHTYIPSIFGVRDASEACAIIGSAGYAEAGNYGSALMSVVNGYNLTRFNR